jgi:aryl-alcohol dehydrogenase-like predicted oxidoreductase
MKYTTLGSTGTTVSRIWLGCMTLGLDSSEKYG